MAPKKKVTSSGDRSKRSTKKPVTQGQNPQRANRQSVSQARVSSSQTRATGTGARVTNAAQRATRLGAAGKILGRAAVPLAIVEEVRSMVDREKRMQALKKKGIQRRSNAAVLSEKSYASAQRFAVPKPKPSKPKSSAASTTTRASTPSRTTSSRTAPPSRTITKPKAAAKTKPPVTSKPSAAQTSGIGPVSSGESYSRMKTSISEQLRELRAMRKASEKRQKKSE